VVVTATLFSFFGPWKGTVRTATRRVLGGQHYSAVAAPAVEVKAVAVPPGSVSAVFQQEDADNVLDHFENTTWATRWVASTTPGDIRAPADDVCAGAAATDSALVFTFAEPTDLARVRIIAGRYAKDLQRTSFSRPRLLELEVDGRCDHIQVADDGKLTAYKFVHRDVTQVIVRVLDIVKDPELSRQVELAEVVFERRR
jgi:hypothetical protein